MVEEGKETTIAYLLGLSGADVARLNGQLADDLVEMHRRARLVRGADPPSEAQFADGIGLKPDTYAKMRRNRKRRRPTRFSRTSLAALALCDALPDAVCKSAHRLLWLAVLHGAKSISKESALVLRALGSRALFAALAASQDCFEEDARSQSIRGGVNAAEH